MPRDFSLATEGVTVALMRPFPVTVPSELLGYMKPFQTDSFPFRAIPEEWSRLHTVICRRFPEPTLCLTSDVSFAGKSAALICRRERIIEEPRLGSWPNEKDWREAFRDVSIGNPKWQYEHAKELVGNATDHAMSAISEQVSSAEEGALLWVITQSPIIDLLIARLDARMKWPRQIMSGDIVLIHFSGAERQARDIRRIRM